MEKILIIGSEGQIGSELTTELRKRYGVNNVIASDIREIPDRYQHEGPFEKIDILDKSRIAEIVKKYKVDTIYNLAAILSAIAEQVPEKAWNIGVRGAYNVLDVAKDNDCAVFLPSSIGAFGPSTPKDNTPQDTAQRPQTMYGVTKVTGELLSDYYYKRFNVDTRGVRFPGIISYVTLPGGGTTDYAVEIFYDAIKYKKFICPIAPGTFMDMMYMPDALNAAIEIMEADPSRLIHRNSFNVTAMSFDPEMLANEIRKYIPSFEIKYKIDPVRQSIADSWPNKLDDTAARDEWGWNPQYNLSSMTKDMLEKIEEKFIEQKF